MKQTITVFLVAIFFLAGCANSPLRLSFMSAEEIQAVPDYDLCVAWYSARPKNVGAELDRRGVFSDAVKLLILDNKLQIGMPECAVVASWGPPTKVHKTSVGALTSYQLIYKRCRVCSTQYVYLNVKGVVTAVQD